MAGLHEVTSANKAVHLHVNTSLSRPPDRSWWRPTGRPRNNWLEQLKDDSNQPVADLCRQQRDAPRRLSEYEDDDSDSARTVHINDRCVIRERRLRMHTLRYWYFRYYYFRFSYLLTEKIRVLWYI